MHSDMESQAACSSLSTTILAADSIAALFLIMFPQHVIAILDPPLDGFLNHGGLPSEEVFHVKDHVPPTVHRTSGYSYLAHRACDVMQPYCLLRCHLRKVLLRMCAFKAFSADPKESPETT